MIDCKQPIFWNNLNQATPAVAIEQAVALVAMAVKNFENHMIFSLFMSGDELAF